MTIDRNARLLEALNHLKLDAADEQAWRGLYCDLWPIVFGRLFHHLHGFTQLAEDACQEVFMRLVRYTIFSKIEDAPSLRRYVIAIAYNVAKDYQRSQGNWERSLSRNDPEPSSNESSAEVRYITNERLNKLAEGLSELDQQLVALRAEGHTNPEIARILGISEANAAVRIHRLRQKSDADRQKM